MKIVKFKVKGEEFESAGHALDYCEENDIALDNIEPYEVETEELSEETELIPDEKSALTPVEFVRETAKDTGGNIPYHSKRPKQYQETLDTKNYFKEYFLRNYESLLDPRSQACGFCSQDWDSIKDKIAPKQPETLGPRDQHKSLADKPLKFRETHLFYKHKNVYDFLVKMGVVQQFEDVKATVVYDDHLKPTNPKNAESLSKEELARRISVDETLRKKFFREWMQRLQQK